MMMMMMMMMRNEEEKTMTTTPPIVSVSKNKIIANWNNLVQFEIKLPVIRVYQVVPDKKNNGNKSVVYFC
jgi:hypothetical protein